MGTAGVDLGACRNILVVKLDFIGDWVLTTPFLAGLRRAAPDARITAVVLDRVFALAGACDLVDRVVAVPAAATGPVAVGAASEGDLAGFLADFGSGAFDLALVPRWDIDFNGATRIAGRAARPSVVGFSEACTERKQVENAGFDRFLDVAVLDTRQCHEVEHTLGLLDALGGKRRRRAPPPRPSGRRPCGRRGLPPGRLRPAGAAAPRRRAVCRRPPPVAARADRGPCSGGRRGARPGRGGDRRPRERSRTPAHLAARIAASGVRAASAAGVLGLRENAALAGMAALFIGMDSGPGHIAAALGVPVVTISAHPEGAALGHPGAPERFAPWVPPDRLLVLRPPAHRPPCSDGCDAGAPHCILEIGVADAVPRVLAFASAAATLPG